jgi:hypothetical protein
VFAFAVAALAVASAKTYNVKLYQTAYVSGTELKAGEYKVDVQDNKAVITSGKTVVEAAVKAETNGTKYGTTVVRMAAEGGKMKIQEIRLGGTNTRLVFNP